MNKSEYNFFVIGLRAAISEAGYQEQEFAKGIMSKENFSKNMSSHQTMKPHNRKMCAAKLGMSEADITEKGRNLSRQQIGRGTDPEMLTFALHRFEGDLVSFVSMYRESKRSLSFLEAIYEDLPVASFVVTSDEMIVYQNRKSRDLGLIAGAKVCDSCAELCEDQDRCPIRISIDKKVETAGHKVIYGNKYLINSAMIRQENTDYWVITAVKEVLS